MFLTSYVIAFLSFANISLTIIGFVVSINSSFVTKSQIKISNFLYKRIDSPANSSHKSELKNSRPSNSLINLNLAEKLSALINEERAEKIASLFFTLVSLQNYSVKFIAPHLAANSYTWRLLEQTLEIRYKATLLTSSFG
jgi:hypothetical protein